MTAGDDTAEVPQKDQTLPACDAPVSIAQSDVTAQVSTESPADDALPAVGKVFEGEKRSLGAIFASNRGAKQRNAPAHVEDSNIEAVPSGEFAPVMQRLRAAMSSHGSGYEGILVHGQIIELADGRAILRYSHKHEASARMLERNGKLEAVQRVLSELLNEPIGLKIEVEPEPSEAPPPSRALQPRVSTVRNSNTARPEPPAVPAAPPLTPDQKQKILETDPLVKTIVNLFDGDIVKAE